MKKNVATLIFLVLTINAYSNEKIFNEIDELVNKNKFKTAYDLLASNIDVIPENDYLKKKTELCINNFVYSMSHEMFSFIDIPEGHDIYDYRGKDGSYDSVVFRVGEEYTNMLKKYPNDAELYFWLAEYYYDVLLRYSGRWFKSDEEIISLALSNYTQAEEKGFSSGVLLANTGYMYLRQGLFEESEKYYRKSFDLKPIDAGTAYNISIALYRQGKYEEARKTIKVAVDNYKDDYYVADSYHIAGDIEINLNNYNTAIEYFEKAKSLNPNNYIYYQRLILLYLHKKQVEKAQSNSVLFFNMYPTNPNAIQYILEQYNSYDKQDELLKLFGIFRTRYSKDNEVMGNIYFHQSWVHNNLGNNKEALIDLEKASEYFNQVFPEDHDVFKEINRLKNDFNK